MADRAFTLTATIADFLTITKFAYTVGSGDGIAVGDTITQGAVTAVVRKITIDSGTFAGGDAAGDIWCQYSANKATGFAGGAATATGDTLTIGAITEDIIDARIPNARYFATFKYTPGAGAASPVFASGIQFGIVITDDDLGFNLNAGDEAFFPLALHHGRGSQKEHGGFFATQFWDASDGPDGALFIIVSFQGLPGIGDKITSTIQDFLHSMDVAASECGKLVSYDLSSATFRIVVMTTDIIAGGGSGSKPDPSDSIGSDDIVVPA